MARLLLQLVPLFLLLVIELFEVEGDEHGRIAIARINARGIKGFIKFTEVHDDIQIQADFQGLKGSHEWHVHILPVDQTADPSVQCLSDMVGPHYDPLGRNVNNSDYGDECNTEQPEMCEVGDLAGKFGPLTPGSIINVTDTTGNLTLSGRYSIIGRSIVIHKHHDRHDQSDHHDHHDTNFECATIRSEEGAEVSLLQATFIQPVAGTIYFRQVYGEDVQIWGKLYYTDDSPDSSSHTWHIHTTAPGEEYKNGYCDNIGGHFGPLGNGPVNDVDYNLTCTPDSTSGCVVGDLTGKHATIDVAASPVPYNGHSFFFTDNFLNLTGVYSVLNTSVAIHEEDGRTSIIACAPLVMSENITLRQYGFDEVTISQGSPFEETLITSTNSRTATTLQSFSSSPLVQCGADVPFSPYRRAIISDPGVPTPDEYDLGDLDARNDDINDSAFYKVFDLPVYGANVSITSLSLRTQREDGVTNCSALIPMLRGDNTIVAKLSFSRAVDGAVYFIQENYGYGQLGNTHIIVDVYYADEGRQKTSGHNWHVHKNAADDVQCMPSIIGKRYNPFNVSTSGNYSTDCSPSSQLRCESGDLTGKHGQLSLQSDGVDRPFYTYVDNNLLLTGSFSVIGRSIGIHDVSSGNPFFDCGTIERVYVSTQEVKITTSQNDRLRSSLTKELTEGTEMDESDVLVLGQRNLYSAFGISCVEVAVRVLGTSQSNADSNAEAVERASGNFNCNGASRSASISLVTLLLMALLYFLTTGK